MNDKTAFSRMLLNEWNRLRETKLDVTLWEAFLSLVGDKVPHYILALRADYDILHLLVSGNSVLSVYRKTGIPTKEIRNVAFTWGITPMNETLDFDPLLVYNENMTPEQMMNKMNYLLPKPLSLDVYKIIIENIEQFSELEFILREENP